LEVALTVTMPPALLQRFRELYAAGSSPAEDIAPCLPTLPERESDTGQDDQIALQAILDAMLQGRDRLDKPEQLGDGILTRYKQYSEDPGSANTKRRVQQRIDGLTALRADLVVLEPDGQILAIEAKRYAGPPPRANTARQTYDSHLDLLHNALDADYLHPYDGTYDGASTAKAGAAVLQRVVADANLLTAVHVDVLPVYAIRPYWLQHRCLAASPTPVQTDTDDADGITQLLAYAELVEAAVTSLIVTFNDRWQLRDYKTAMLQIVDSLLASALRMLVVLLAAIAHQATVPIFLLVMLGSIRHYGRRGEPDDSALSALALRSSRHQGTVRLAA
jgi:hypothetical protein